MSSDWRWVKGEWLRQPDREQADPGSPETMKWLIWLKHVCEEFWYRGQSGENLRAEESRIYQEHWESTTLEITHTGGCGRPRLTTTYHSSWRNNLAMTAGETRILIPELMRWLDADETESQAHRWVMSPPRRIKHREGRGDRKTDNTVKHWSNDQSRDCLTCIGWKTVFFIYFFKFCCPPWNKQLLLF